MTTDEIELVLQRVVRRELERWFSDLLTPDQRTVFAVAVSLYDVHEKFTANSMLDAARYDEKAHKALRLACEGDAAKLGIQLGQIADCRAVLEGVRLRRLPKEAGIRRWQLEAIDPL